MNISVTAITSTTIIVSWSPPNIEVQNGFIRNYSIIITDTNNEIFLYVSEVLTTTEIGNLKPFTKYYVHVAASTIGVGPFAEPVLVYMPESSN